MWESLENIDLSSVSADRWFEHTRVVAQRRHVTLPLPPTRTNTSSILALCTPRLFSLSKSVPPLEALLIQLDAKYEFLVNNLCVCVCGFSHAKMTLR